MQQEALIRAHLERHYQIVNLKPYLESQAHLGFCYFEGNSVVDGRRVFIKVDGTYGESASREASLIGQFDNRHFPNLIAYEANGPLSFVLLEWIEGIPLETILKHRTQLTNAQKENLLRQLVSILKALHHSEIIHRDIRPANIMIDMLEEKWRMILFDFAFSIRKGSNPWPELGFLSPRVDLLRDLGGAEYKPDALFWDDAYSVCQVASKIDAACERSFPEIWDQMKSLIGKLTHDGSFKT